MKNVVRLTESELVRLVEKVLSEQTPQPGPKRTMNSAQPGPGSIQGKNQFGPYCKIGKDQGIIKQHAVAIGGPNKNMGETGFGLFDPSGRMVCKISTTHTEGGYVATTSK